MAKVTINGETFGYDAGRRPIFEALEIERVLKCRFGEWEMDVISDESSMRSAAGLAWTVLYRNGVQHDGHPITLDDVLSGAYEIDLLSIRFEPEPAADEAGAGPPTSPPPDPSPTTGSGTSARSRKSSA